LLVAVRGLTKHSQRAAEVICTVRIRAAIKYDVEGQRTPPDAIRNTASKLRLAGSPEAVLKAGQSEFLASRRGGDAVRKKSCERHQPNAVAAKDQSKRY
jgi:hypothetical protein